MWVPVLLALALGLRTAASYRGNPPLRGVGLALHATRGAKAEPIAVARVPALLTDMHMARIMVAGDRYVVPGDFVVNELYGVGKYLGIRQVNISPAQEKQTFVPSVVVQYLDGEVTWFEKFVQRELWVFRTAESGEQELGSILDLRKWNRKKKTVQAKSRRTAMNLINLMAVRNALHRTPCVPDDQEYAAFERRFGYTPTDDQATCFLQVAADMVNNTRPMDRLVCGDVGFGKTEVAMRAIYRAVRSNKQVALLAPTRVLAKQHERTLKERMPDVNIQLLRGGGKGGAKEVKEALRLGECQIVIGTHALLQPSVDFNNLGLLVIDEEQRFGVAHKEKLKTTASGADVLTLSATPIPRTLQMSLSGLRDFSMMRSPPKGRREVQVFVGPEGGVVESTQPATGIAAEGALQPSGTDKPTRATKTSKALTVPKFSAMSGISGVSDDGIDLDVPRVQRDAYFDVHAEAWAHGAVLRNAVVREIKRGGQVFVVVPFVKMVAETTERLQALIPGVRVIEAHGRHEDLEDRIDAFVKQEADVLVATTVIENGIDMPSVNTIVVLTADRFGMSTLYQLKGRVGRGLRQAYAYFLTSNSTITTEAEQRLTYVKTFTALGSGYDLARRDMEMRGHGTVFGEEQSGARDIGLDLQASMLSAAVETIQQELIMCVPDSRVEVGDELEALGVRVGPLPAATDVNAISRWEARLTEEVARELLGGMAEVAAPVRKGAKKLPATIAEASVEGAKPRRKAKIEPAQGTADAGADFCRRILSASSTAEITDIVTRFAKIVNTRSGLLEQLERRYRLRMAARRLGITELRRREQLQQGDSGGGSVEFVMRAPGLTDAKWADLQEVIPRDCAQRLQYKGVLAKDPKGVPVPAGGAIRYVFVQAGTAVTAETTAQGLEVLMETLEVYATYAKETLDLAVGKEEDDVT